MLLLTAQFKQREAETQRGSDVDRQMLVQVLAHLLKLTTPLVWLADKMNSSIDRCATEANGWIDRVMGGREGDDIMKSVAVCCYGRISMPAKVGDREEGKRDVVDWMEEKQKVRILTSALTSRSCLQFSLCCAPLSSVRHSDSGCQTEVLREMWKQESTARGLWWVRGPQEEPRLGADRLDSGLQTQGPSITHVLTSSWPWRWSQWGALKP